MKISLRYVLLFWIAVSLKLTSCSQKYNGGYLNGPPIDTVGKSDTAIVAVYGSMTRDASFSDGVLLGLLSPDTLTEASGLAASRLYPGFLWTHNDSGNPNDIYLIDSTAAVRAIISVMNRSNRDWEDIAIGPGPQPGVNYIYLGDIGDNDQKHSISYVYRFPEPQVTIGAQVYHGTVANSDAITFSYPDGPHNAETLMLDPLTKDIYIASKNQAANIYFAPYPQKIDSAFVMKKVAVLPLSILTAGDISPDGSEILMKDYGFIYHWKRNAGESVVAALLRTPQTEPYVGEIQGEAVCWSPTGDAYYTTSEYANKVIAGLNKYKRK